MARSLRIQYAGALYHIISRGNGQAPIFADDTDKEAFLDLLTRVNKKYNLICHAYCLMNNHYHLVIETPDGNLSAAMRQLNGVYTGTFNRRHQRSGHVFQGRYKAILVQKESYLLEVIRYVALNPIRAKIAKLPRDYAWSSYTATVGLANAHPCLFVDWVLAQFDERKKSAQERYSRFVSEGLDKTLPLPSHPLICGDINFARKIGDLVKEPDLLKEIPKAQRYVDRPSVETLFSLANDRKERNQMIKKAIYKWGHSQKEIADHLNLHYSTISRLVNGK